MLTFALVIKGSFITIAFIFVILINYELKIIINRVKNRMQDMIPNSVQLLSQF